LASRLAEQYPEVSPAAERGTLIHAEIAAGLGAGGILNYPESRAANDWATKQLTAAAMLGPVVDSVEVKAELKDPDTDEVITSGTADFVIEVPGQPLRIFDWKTGRRENVAPAADNLQLIAYGLALALERGADAFQVGAVFLDGDRVTVDEGPVVPQSEWWPWLARIKAAASKEASATVGPHCGGCYQRAVCGSYRERATTALALLPTTTTALALTDETAAELVQRVAAIQEACDTAMIVAKAHVESGGRVVAGGKEWRGYEVAGRRSGPSLGDLEAAGLGHMIKAGRPSQRWEWRKVKP